MKHFSIILSLILLAACGKPNYEKDVRDIVSNFEITYNVSVGLPITFVEEMPGAAVGIAYGTTRIELLRSYWDTQNDNGKEQILYHELGHAFFGLGHITDVTPYLGGYSRPISIMYPVAFGEEYYYEKFKSDYKSQLYSAWKARSLVHEVVNKGPTICNGSDLE